MATFSLSYEQLFSKFAGAAFDPQIGRYERLHDIFQIQVLLHPNRPAVRDGDRILTYAELDAAANQLERWLRQHGVERGKFVAFCLPRSPEVYITMLAILKSGAAYVPLDPQYPIERLRFILQDAQVHSLITDSTLSAVVLEECNLIYLDQIQAELAALEPTPLMEIEDTVRPEDPCYIIYTSGSTGKPKGVLISHQSASNLVRSEASVLQIRAEDLVFQGFSVAFDASIEEIWISFLAGACLIVGTSAMIHAGADLGLILTQAGVTVLCCVPTLLSMIETEMPSLRLINLVGEPCPPELVKRWSRPGRRILNTYGPTEATVTATWAECQPDQPIAIGRPLPNYSVFILDEQMNHLPVGEPGELHIGGIGLAMGYLNRPELTAEKFVPNPFYSPERRDPLLYRTGDLAVFTPEGQIQFLGRMDGQVKLRGFRIELGEIESLLLQFPSIKAAVVDIRRKGQGIEQLIAWVVLKSAQDCLDEAGLREFLSAKLPTYMIPTQIEVLDCLPTLASGKVDRKRLPEPTVRPAVARQEAILPPLNSTEQAIADIWQQIFPHAQISVEDNFFLDLGGHSLLAASMVSQLRSQPRFAHVSMLDVYECPTIVTLAVRLMERAATPKVKQEKEIPSFNQINSRRYLISTAVQGLGLLVILFFFSLQWLLPYLTYTWMEEIGASTVDAIITGIVAFAAIVPLMFAISIAVKWLVLGRVKPGKYPLWGGYYLRWWFVNQLLSIVPTGLMSGTPLLNLYYRLLGAKIGSNVYLSSVDMDAPDLTTIGADSSIGYEAGLSNATVEQGWLKIGRIAIGDRCFVGASAVLSENTVMEDDSSLEDLSLLPPRQRIPQGDIWAGSPAAAVAIAPSPESQSDRISGRKRTAGRTKKMRPSWLRCTYFSTLQVILLMTLPILELAPIFPGVVVMYYRNETGVHRLLLSPLIAISFIVLMALQIALLKWLIVGRVQPGKCRLDSHRYIRLWYVDKLMALSLDIIRPLYATLYLLPWYRLLGAKLGRWAEISTPSSLVPDLVRIGEESFIADGVVMGVPRVERGWMSLRSTRIGKRSFIGNSALLPAGVTIGDDTLIGCMSVPPADTSQVAKINTSWFGSPAIFLPQRQVFEGFSKQSTYEPTLNLVLQRLSFELIRVIFSLSCVVMLSDLLLGTMIDLYDDLAIWKLLLALPFLYLGFGLAAIFITAGVKWLVIGRYKPTEQPLWSRFVWRAELVTCIHETLAVPFFVDMLRGTLFINLYLRLMGCKIGKRVFTNTTDITEFDVIRVGNDVALNGGCGLQTHLFEDRVMKISTVTISDRCSVGNAAIVLYDTVMEPSSSLGNLSMLMKGETLPTASCWIGSPARSWH